MNPFFWLMGMYVGFAALLFVAGYAYKTRRDLRNKRMHEQERELQRRLNFEAKEHDVPKPEQTLVTR